MNPDLKEELLDYFEYGTAFDSDRELLEAFITRHLAEYNEGKEPFRQQVQAHFAALRKGIPPFPPVPVKPVVLDLVDQALTEWVLDHDFSTSDLYLAAFKCEIGFLKLQQEMEQLRAEQQKIRQRVQGSCIENNLN